MPSPLDAVRLKTARARKHFDDCKAMLGFGPNPLIPPKVTGIHLKEDGTLEVTLSDATEPGPQVGLVLGDAIHQLRSALDHLVCALVMRSHPSDTCEKFRLQFPIHKDLNEFCANRLVKHGTLRCLVGAREFEMIEKAQPYERNPIRPETDPVYVLGKLDNIDKHRLIIDLKYAVSAAGTMFPQSGPPMPFDVSKQMMQAQTQPLALSAYPPKPFTVKVDRLTPEIIVPESDAHVFSIFGPAEKIVNDLITSYEPFF